MKRRGIYVLILFLFLISLTVISAQPPFQPTIIDQGIEIVFPQFETLKQGENFTYHFHTMNLTDGTFLTDSEVTCSFHLYNSTGNHIVQFNNNVPYNAPLDWEVLILGGNFTDKGLYGYLFECNSTSIGIGGSVAIGMEVTPTGMIIENSESLLYFIVAFGVFLLFIISFYFMLITPYGNKRDEGGAVIQLTKLKYVKLGFILLTWVLLTWFLNILVGISENFIILTMYSGFFGFIFDLMNRLALPLGIIIIVIALFEIIRDVNILKELKKFGSSTG